MTCKVRVILGPVLQQVLVVGALALLAPLASRAKSVEMVCNPGTVCLGNDGGTLTAGSTLSIANSAFCFFIVKRLTSEYPYEWPRGGSVPEGKS